MWLLFLRAALAARVLDVQEPEPEGAWRSVRSSGEATWILDGVPHRLMKDEDIPDDASIRTLAARVTLQAAPGVTVLVGEDSFVSVSAVGAEVESGWLLQWIRDRVYTGTWNVLSGTTTASHHGTVFRVAREGDTTLLEVWNGTVYADGPLVSDPVRVIGGHSLRVADGLEPVAAARAPRRDLKRVGRSLWVEVGGATRRGDTSTAGGLIGSLVLRLRGSWWEVAGAATVALTPGAPVGLDVMPWLGAGPRVGPVSLVVGPALVLTPQYNANAEYCCTVGQVGGLAALQLRVPVAQHLSLGATLTAEWAEEAGFGVGGALGAGWRW